jgi:hypothetical protein
LIRAKVIQLSGGHCIQIQPSFFNQRYRYQDHPLIIRHVRLISRLINNGFWKMIELEDLRVMKT